MASEVEPNPSLSIDNNNVTKIVRFYNLTIPEDNYLDNYGDLILNYNNNNNNDLIARDTITNEFYEEDIEITYTRKFPRLNVTNVWVLNYGRQRGYCYSALIHHKEKYVEVKILVKAGKAVRILVEVYGKKLLNL